MSQTDERIDYDALAEVAEREQPKMITAGASAYPRIIDFQRMREIAESVGAYLFVDMAHIAGLVAAGVHPSPMPHADFVTTTTHKTLRGPRGGIIICQQRRAREEDRLPGLPRHPGRPARCTSSPPRPSASTKRSSPAFKAYPQQIVQQRQGPRRRARATTATASSAAAPTITSCSSICARSGLNGKIASETLDHAGITVNKNGIPFDTEKITLGGGIRVGTPAVTTRGMKEEEMMEIADLIHRALSKPKDERRRARQSPRRSPRPHRGAIPLPG